MAALASGTASDFGGPEAVTEVRRRESYAPGLHRFVTLDVVLLDTVTKVVAADSQSAGGFRLVPVVLSEGFDDHRTLRRP